MSYCDVTGFFRIAGGLQIALYQQHPYITGVSSPETSTPSQDGLLRFTHYNSTISATSKPVAFADICAPDPINNDIVPTKAMVFLIGSVFLQSGSCPSIIDATFMQIFPGDVNAPMYHNTVPRFPATYIDAIGTVSRRHTILQDGSRAFTITISQFVRDSIKRFKLTYVSFPSYPCPCSLLLQLRFDSREPPLVQFRHA
jgi:hypothetical protein